MDSGGDREGLRRADITQDAFLAKAQRRVKDSTSFVLVIVDTVHRTLLQLITSQTLRELPNLPDAAVHLTESGNCILLALWRLAGETGRGALQHQRADYASKRPVASSSDGAMSLRRYSQCIDVTGWHCIAKFGFDPDFGGKYLPHCESGNCPHCVALRVDEAVKKSICWTGDRVFTINLPDLVNYSTTGIDHNLVVPCFLTPEGQAAPSVYLQACRYPIAAISIKSFRIHSHRPEFIDVESVLIISHRF